MRDTSPAVTVFAPIHFFRARWHGQVSHRRLFYWDMLGVATLLNAALALVSLILLAKGWDGSVWLLLHAVLVPYNIFLLASLWRHVHAPALFRVIGTGWFGMTLLV
ncbi:MAG: hypothetical protein KGZ68_14785 [Dechloromonas sp.]|jgi:hypothetical protein|nr:hypothetical protein [Dechloromonas sp.]